MIKSIELRNWKTHKSSTIEFRKGVNVILGVMGAGKSSVLDAISYALFGSFPGLSSRRVSIGNLVTNRPAEERSAEVRLKFEVDGLEYTVSRRITANSSSSASLLKGGEYLQAQPERVTEAIEELLKVDYDTFAKAIYSQQNELDYFLEQDKAGRKKGIDGMLGLDAFASAEENSTSLINRIRELVQGDEKTLAGMKVGELRAQAAALEKEMHEVEMQHARLLGHEVECRLEYEAAGRELDAKKKDYERKKALEREAADLSSKADMLSREAKKIEEATTGASLPERLTDAKKRSAGLEKAKEQLALEERRLQREVSETETLIRQLQVEALERNRLSMEVSEGLIRETEARLCSSRERAEGLRAASSSDSTQLGEALKWLSELKGHAGKCPLCEQALNAGSRERLISERERLAAALKGQISDSMAKLAAEEKVIKELEPGLRGLTAKMDALRKHLAVGIDERLSIAAVTMKEKKAGYEDAVMQARGADAAAKELHAEISSLEQTAKDIARKEGYQRQIEEYTALCGRKKGEAEALSVDEKVVYGLQDRFTRISSDLSETSSKIEGNRRYAQSLAIQAAEKKELLARLCRLEAGIRARRAQLANMNKFKAALMETEAQLRNRLVSAINEIMQGIWPELYPYGDYHGIRLEAGKDDYLLQVRVSSNGAEAWHNVNSLASGGERSVACLAMRIAFSMVVVPNLRWLILDEPTHNIDSNGIEKLVHILGETLPSIVDQVFVITHDDALKRISNASIYNFERDKGVHGYTVVSQS